MFDYYPYMLNIPGLQQQAPQVDRSVPHPSQVPQAPAIQMPQAVPMPQGMNQQAGLLAKGQPMQAQQLMQMMQGLNSPYLKYLLGGG